MMLLNLEDHLPYRLESDMKILLLEMSGPITFVVGMGILVIKEKFLTKKRKQYTKLWIPKVPESYKRNLGGW